MSRIIIRGGVMVTHLQVSATGHVASILRVEQLLRRFYASKTFKVKDWERKRALKGEWDPSVDRLNQGAEDVARCQAPKRTPEAVMVEDLEKIDRPQLQAEHQNSICWPIQNQATTQDPYEGTPQPPRQMIFALGDGDFKDAQGGPPLCHKFARLLDEKVKSRDNRPSHGSKVKIIIRLADDYLTTKTCCVCRSRVEVSGSTVRTITVDINQALQNLHLVRKIILTQNLDDHQEQAALTRLDQLLDQISVNSLAALNTAELQDLASALIATTSPKELTQILSSIRTINATTIKETTITTAATTSNEDDNVSVTSSEGPSSAVTVVDELDHLSLSVRSNLSLGIQNEAHLLQLTSGNLAVEHVAYALSDLVFVYPSTSSHSYLGHASEQWSKAGLGNFTGAALAPQVLKMSTRSNAASAVLGAVTSSESKTNLATLASSAAIVNMVPNLYQIAQANTPVVFHVTAESVDADLNLLRGDYSNVLVARETGLLYLASNSVQEAYDVSILAHAVASGTSQSVLHVLDGVQTSQQVEAIKTTKDQDIAKFIKQEQGKSVLGHDEGSLVSGIEDIFERAASLLGRRYKAFEYTGPEDADTIVVVFGPAHNVATDLGDKVGVLNIRLYRPWSFSHFLNAVPASAKKIVVVEPVAATAAHGPIFLDVSASFNLWTGAHRPSVVDAKYGLHGSSLSQGWLKAVVQKAVRSQGELELAAVIANADAAQDDVDQVIFWETASSTAVSAHVAKHIQSVLGQRIQHNSRVNSYRHSAVIETRVQFTKSHTVALGESILASYASVEDVSVLAEYNVVGSLKQGAVLVLNAPWSVEELESKTSAAFRFALGAKQIQVLLIDFAHVAKELGLSGAGKTLLGQIAFLKTFSSSLREAAFEAVGHQYETTNSKLLKDLISTLVERVDKEVIEVPQNPNWLAIELGEADQAALALPMRVLPTVRGTANAFDSALSNSTFDTESSSESEVVLGKTSNWHKAAWQLLFSEAYDTKQVLSDSDHAYLVKITENRRLTPTTYDRNVFHLEFDTTNTGLKYEIGDALGIHGWNDTQEVLDFIEFYGEKPETIVVVPRALAKNAPEGTQARHQTNSLFQILQQTLDLFGRPSKRFYADLIPFATNQAEKECLSHLISAEGATEFKERVEETLTHADILREFPSAHPSIPQLINMLPAIKPRHYSIASSQKAHPNSVHLLIVAVEWTAPSGKARFGQCTRYLTSLGVGDQVTVSIKPSVMTLPPLPHQPVIMAGLGTGMAPFRAFIQERAWQRAQGIEVGPMILYFGSRNRANEYLYGEELEAYHADGLLTHLRLAFSRDQKEKIYIQHKMNEDGSLLHKYLLDSQLNGHFYLCGPTWPAGDVKDAIVQSFMDGEACAAVDANRLVNRLKEEERYVLEVRIFRSVPQCPFTSKLSDVHPAASENTKSTPTSPIFIRLAGPENDIELVDEIFRIVKISILPQISRDTVIEALNDKVSGLVLAFDSATDHVVGTLQLAPSKFYPGMGEYREQGYVSAHIEYLPKDKQILLCPLRIEPAHRSRGLGRRLVENGLNYAKETLGREQAMVYVLFPQTEISDLYKRLGFVDHYTDMRHPL
ncbi:hypothetical protein BGX28_006626 [Mortierella sp. GBA30]|nr:hypothetical protein BGX28_006626 [Mortierella sp. GBA30]